MNSKAPLTLYKWKGAAQIWFRNLFTDLLLFYPGYILTRRAPISGLLPISDHKHGDRNEDKGDQCEKRNRYEP